MTEGVVLFILLGIKRSEKVTKGVCFFVRFTGLAHSILGRVLTFTAV
jgi:hypothetical protein